MSFIGQINVSAARFYELFKEHDKDGNGYLQETEGELDHLITALLKEVGKKMNYANWQKTLADLKQCDENKDGKISATELSKMLVPTESFLYQFREKTNISSVDLMKAWRNYDTDKSGTIAGKEIEKLTHDIMSVGGTVVFEPTFFQELKDALMKFADKNRDGTISLSEFAAILPVEQNFFTKCKKLTTEEDFKKIVAKYDTNTTGLLDQTGLESVLRVMITKDGGSLDDVAPLTNGIYEMLKTEDGGKISTAELKMCIVQKK